MHYFIVRQYRTGEIQRYETRSLWVALFKVTFTSATDVRLIKAWL